MRPGVCLSIVSHGQHDLASRLLACLCEAPSTAIDRVIYTRNLPEPALDAALVKRIRSIADWQVIDNERPAGFGRNHNAAFSRCQSRHFAVLNPDITWTREPVTVLRDTLDGDQDLGIVAPVVLSPGGRIENTARLLYSPVELAGQKRQPTNHATRPAWLAGMFLCFRAQAYAAIGGFDERFHLYVEDVDICSRMRLAGWGLRQVGDAVVVHDAQRASHRSWRHRRWHLAGMLRYWTSPIFWNYRAMLMRDDPREPPPDSMPGQ